MRAGAAVRALVQRKMLALLRFARLHKCAEAREFLKRWEAAPVNPGGDASE